MHDDKLAAKLTYQYVNESNEYEPKIGNSTKYTSIPGKNHSINL